MLQQGSGEGTETAESSASPASGPSPTGLLTGLSTGLLTGPSAQHPLVPGRTPGGRCDPYDLSGDRDERHADRT
jgi:hypothetical protein